MIVSSVIRKTVFVLLLASFQMHLRHMILYRWGCLIKARMIPFEFFLKGTLISFKICVPVFGTLRIPIVGLNRIFHGDFGSIDVDMVLEFDEDNCRM